MCNVFKDLEDQVEKAIETSNVYTFRQAICEVLYLPNLKLVSLNKAKLFTDECENGLNNDVDPKNVLEIL